MNKEKTLHPIYYLDFILSTGYFIVTLIILQLFSAGWFMIIISSSLVLYSVYRLIKWREARPLLATYTLYFVLLFSYFLIWGFSDWGIAFIGLFAKIITPFFILSNVALLIALTRHKK